MSFSFSSVEKITCQASLNEFYCYSVDAFPQETEKTKLNVAFCNVVSGLNYT